MFKKNYTECCHRAMTTNTSDPSIPPSRPTYISIDVEAAATGYGHLDREPCWIAVVDEVGTELLNIIVDVPQLVSPLTSITGLRTDQIRGGMSLADALHEVHTLLCSLGSNVVLVGQKPQGDIAWLQLKQGVHYAKCIDLAEEFRCWNAKYKSWNYYSLAKEAFALLNVQMHGNQSHSPLVDAQISMRLYNEFVRDPTRLKKAVAKLQRMTIHRAFPPELMAVNRNQNIDGVCGFAFDPSKCTCNQPTLRHTPR